MGIPYTGDIRSERCRKSGKGVIGMFVKNSSAVMKKVLVSRPTYLQAAPINEIAKKWNHTRLDTEKMEREHHALVQAYRENGVEVEFLEADPKRPNSVFSRDFGGCIREGYLLGNFREPIRFEEKEAYRKKMEELGVPVVAECKSGLFEGGDFTYLDDHTLAIGMVARTNPEGIEELRAAVSPLGYRIVPVPCDEKYLHFDLLFNLASEHLALAYREALPEEFLSLLDRMEIETIPVPTESIFGLGCNIQSIGGNRVLSLKQNGRVNEEMDRRGVKVIELDITEILKAGGGPHCMTFPLERD